MQDILPDGGVIRKLWIGEADKYREHLLRLELGEPAQPVRRRRIRRLHPQFRGSQPAGAPAPAAARPRLPDAVGAHRPPLNFAGLARARR